MDSIAHPAGKWQRLPDKPISVYPSGISIPKRGLTFVPSHLSDKSRHQRGEITSFNSHTRKRLRLALLTKTIANAVRVGATYTVPWKGTNFAPLMGEFRECLHRFRTSFLREYPNSGFIYRVELQQRGAPHFHALTYISRKDLPADVGGARGVPSDVGGKVLAELQVMLSWLWVAAVPDLHRGSYNAFSRSGVKVEAIANDGALMRYICDHTSKHKQAQLGYQGKQWGIVGGKNFVTLESEALPDFVNERHAVVFARTLRKIMRYRITDKRHKWKRPPPFGSVLKGSRRTVGEFYLSRDNVIRLWLYSSNVPRGTFV